MEVGKDEFPTFQLFLGDVEKKVPFAFAVKFFPSVFLADVFSLVDVRV